MRIPAVTKIPRLKKIFKKFVRSHQRGVHRGGHANTQSNTASSASVKTGSSLTYLSMDSEATPSCFSEYKHNSVFVFDCGKCVTTRRKSFFSFCQASLYLCWCDIFAKASARSRRKQRKTPSQHCCSVFLRLRRKCALVSFTTVVSQPF